MTGHPAQPEVWKGLVGKDKIETGRLSWNLQGEEGSGRGRIF
jgi:hypothetical protein